MPDVPNGRSRHTDSRMFPKLDVGRDHVDALHPQRPTGHGARLEPHRCSRRRRKPAQTRPRPFFGSPNQPRSQRIALNVPQDRQQVLIFLDGKCFESTLPDVTAGSITHPGSDAPAWSSATASSGSPRRPRAARAPGGSDWASGNRPGCRIGVRTLDSGHQVEESVVIVGPVEHRARAFPRLRT